MGPPTTPQTHEPHKPSEKSVSDAAKLLLNEAIADKLNIKDVSSSKTFRIADLGCSLGPNTFFVVQNILEGVELKYQSQGLNSPTPEFQVFFNDHASNDFNTLFRSLPVDKQYYVAGVPGSFYSGLFPCASLHFVHSSFALHWLSKVPKEVVEKSSPAWNKGRIHYSNAGNEVVKAYSTQYAMDMGCFLHARAQEMVCGGLMVVIVPARPNKVPHSQAIANLMFDILGSCLMDMAKKGIVEEEKVDSFNIPIYYASPQELEAAIYKNGYFSIERMENLPCVTTHDNLSKAKLFALSMRAGMEGFIKEQFGPEIVDELFDSFRKKLEEASSIYDSGKALYLFVLLKRKIN
ncbi:hypothetical protein F0562_023927 [Nyssa sinensis]|uniref:S-adenosylmethionine-dependent methyltransferase n=1 Tax=Nyssa sinensis TaxID=561372 RepID=A0A5J5BI03_9ASTE|nr:hypothetical protein F0562_023927 [Nyssa sinensis]